MRTFLKKIKKICLGYFEGGGGVGSGYRVSDMISIILGTFVDCTLSRISSAVKQRNDMVINGTAVLQRHKCTTI